MLNLACLVQRKTFSKARRSDQIPVRVTPARSYTRLKMPPLPEHPFPVVGVGASAGGLSALTTLLDALPPRPGLALVIVQHLDPKRESHLDHILAPHTSMKVVEARHGTKVAPDHVYVIQPNTSVADDADGRRALNGRQRSHSCRNACCRCSTSR